MESVSNTLDNSRCLQLVDKQGTPSGTRQHFPHEVNEDEAKNMTAQGCKHPDRTAKRDNTSYKYKPRVPPLPDRIREFIAQHILDRREVRIPGQVSIQMWCKVELNFQKIGKRT